MSYTTREAKYEFTAAQREHIQRYLGGCLKELTKAAPDGEDVAYALDSANSDFFRAFDFELGVVFETSRGRTVHNASGGAFPVLIFDGGAWPMPAQLTALLVHGTPIADYDALRAHLDALDRDGCTRARPDDSLAWESGDVYVYAGYGYQELRAA